MYNKIDVGKTYEEVKEILGDGGTNTVDTKLIKSYTWTNDDKSTISANFMDNAVTSKSQDNLPPTLSGSKAVTLKMFNKINEGMTTKQVTDILGEGTPRVMVMKDGKKEIMMGWDNSDGSNITVTLLDGIVTDKDDLMLK